MERISAPLRRVAFATCLAALVASAALHGADGAKTKSIPNDRNPFTGVPFNASSVSRADLSVCSVAGPRVAENPRDLAVSEMAQQLRGTWVREVTWHGAQIETTGAMFLATAGNTLTGIIFDRSNLEKGPLWHALQVVKADPGRLMNTPVITYVSCGLGVVDKYYRVSDQLLLDQIGIAQSQADALRTAFEQLSTNDFLHPDFSRAIAYAQSRGSLPEILAPSVKLALWSGELKPANIGGRKAVTLRVEGVYRDSFLSPQFQPVRKDSTGTELANFFRNGDDIVSTVGFAVDGTAAAKSKRKQSRTAERSASLENAALGGGWWADDCAPELGNPIIAWDRVVLSSGR